MGSKTQTDPLDVACMQRAGYPGPVSSLAMSLSAAAARSCYPSVLVYNMVSSAGKGH